MDNINKIIVNKNIENLLERITDDDVIIKHFFKLCNTKVKTKNDSKKKIIISVNLNLVDDLPKEFLNYINFNNIIIKINQVVKKNENGNYIITYKGSIIEPNYISNLLKDFKYIVTLFVKKIDENNSSIKLKTSHIGIDKDNKGILKMAYDIFLNYADNIFSNSIRTKFFIKIKSIDDI